MIRPRGATLFENSSVIWSSIIFPIYANPKGRSLFKIPTLCGKRPNYINATSVPPASRKERGDDGNHRPSHLAKKKGLVSRLRS
jgi:hypothetical protein